MKKTITLLMIIIPFLTFAQAWEFNTAGNAQGWTTQQGGPTPTGGAITATGTAVEYTTIAGGTAVNRNPGFVLATGAGISAATSRQLEIRVRNATAAVNLRMTTNGGGATVAIITAGDTDYQTYTLTIGTGNNTAITSIALEFKAAGNTNYVPSGAEIGKVISIDYVRVTGTTTWNGTTWFQSTTPTAFHNAIIDGTYSTTTNGTINANSLTVNATRTLTINSGTNVTVQNAVTNNGTMTIASGANLIQVNNVANAGSVTVNRNGSTLKRLDYTLWSSPVAPNQTLKNFSEYTVDPRFYQYNESTNQYNAVAPSSTTFATGKGYLIRMPDQNPTALGNNTPYYTSGATLSFAGAFSGVLNNGNIPVTLALSSGANKGFQAVGNPYPSVIDAQTFLTANTANIENTLYFWRKTNGAGGSAYATWTSGGGTSVTPSSETPSGKIQVGQGFIVKAKNAVTVSNFFTNAMRDAAPSSTQFFKTKQQAQKDRVWLNLTNTSGAFSQALVAYIDDAAIGIDQYDGKYINDSDIALTTSIAGDEYTIQGRPAFDATDVVALNFKTSAAGTYSIGLDHVEGLFSKGQDIYLVDKTTGTTTNLNEGAYTFTAAVGVDNTRFTLTYQKTLKVGALIFNENSVLVSRNNGTLNVKSTAVAINNVKVYDVQGRLVAERKNVKSNSAAINNLRTNQVLIVKVTSENNVVVTKKVLN